MISTETQCFENFPSFRVTDLLPHIREQEGVFRGLMIDIQWGADTISKGIDIDFTAQPRGGRRLWFICPTCGRRRGRLIICADEIMCRSCAPVRYRSQIQWRERRWIKDCMQRQIKMIPE